MAGKDKEARVFTPAGTPVGCQSASVLNCLKSIWERTSVSQYLFHCSASSIRKYLTLRDAS